MMTTVKQGKSDYIPKFPNSYVDLLRKKVLVTGRILEGGDGTRHLSNIYVFYIKFIFQVGHKLFLALEADTHGHSYNKIFS